MNINNKYQKDIQNTFNKCVIIDQKEKFIFKQ